MVPQRHLARMAPHHLPESLGSGVEVAPGGVQGGMAQQGLQLDHVSSGLQGGGGEGVAQGVHLGHGRDPGSQPGPDVEPLDQVLDLVHQQPLATDVDEQGSGGVVEVVVLRGRRPVVQRATDQRRPRPPPTPPLQDHIDDPTDAMI
jgi:hypothetical protein